MAPDRVAKVVEVTDHHRREVKVELPTWRRADPEAVAHPRRDEDERTRRARDLAVVQEHQVFAVKNVEGFGGIVVDVERRSEPWRLLGFEEREDSVGLIPARLDRHPERAQVDRPAFAWREHERLAWTCHGDPLPNPLSDGPCHRGV